MASLLKSAITVYICGASPSTAERTQREKYKIIYVYIIHSLFHTLSVQVATQGPGERVQLSSPSSLKDIEHQSDCKRVSSVCMEKATEL